MCLHSLKVSGSLLIPAGRLSCAYCKRLFITWQAVRTAAWWRCAVLFLQYPFYFLIIVFLLGWVSSSCRFDLLDTSSCSTRTLELVVFQIHVCVSAVRRSSATNTNTHPCLSHGCFFSNRYSAVKLFIQLPVNLCVCCCPASYQYFLFLSPKSLCFFPPAFHQIFWFGRRL